MKGKRINIFCSIAIIVCAIAIALLVFMRDTTRDVTYVSCSWEYGYKDVEELAANSDVIALIDVDKLAETRSGISPACYFDVTVTEAIYGCEKGETLRIYMTGGIDSEGDFIEVDVDPFMEEGQQFLIFARKNETGTYSVLGGPQGRMEYKDNVLNTLNHTTLLEPAKSYKAKMTGNSDVTLELPGTVDVNNKTLDELMPDIEKGLQNR